MQWRQAGIIGERTGVGLGSAPRLVAALRVAPLRPARHPRCDKITEAKKLKGRHLEAEETRGFTSTFASLVRGPENGVHFKASPRRPLKETAKRLALSKRLQLALFCRSVSTRT